MDLNDLVVAIGGAAGDGVASAGNSLALAMARQGQAVYAYNSYQSVIRGGHSYLRMRVSARKPLNHGDRVDALIALNQDTLERHLQELNAGGVALYNSAKLKPTYDAPDGVRLCPLPVPELAPAYRELPVIQNIVAVGAVIRLMGLDFAGIESVLQSTFAEKPKIVQVNVDAAKAGYEYVDRNFKLDRGDENLSPGRFPQLRKSNQRWAVVTGNELLAMGAAFAGCRFYCAYPMSPATHILEWFAAHGKELGICVRQVEDEISVVNMTIGANHMGVRGMCATSGGGFALMTESIGMAGMIETPLVLINVMRAGPSTGVPTKTEQADLNQAFGASQGDFPRIILAPLSMLDCFHTSALAFNLADRYQCPVIILSDLLLSEGNETVDPALLDVEFPIDRGELITSENQPSSVERQGQDEGEWATDGGNLITTPEVRSGPFHWVEDVELSDVRPTNGNGAPYLRYKNTPSGISPRAVPGVPGYLYVSGSDEHDEDGVLISDVYTDTARRKKMVDKRARKFSDVLNLLPSAKLEGPLDAEVTLVGWGSTWGVIHEAVERLNRDGISANYLQFKVLVPFHAQAAQQTLGKSRRIIVVENNHSGQFARHLRAETGIAANAHIRKYDGEPFEPKHIVAGVKEILEKGSEVIDVLSTEPGWRTEHPSGTSGDWPGRQGDVAARSRQHVH